jgi:hypothetical protein
VTAKPVVNLAASIHARLKKVARARNIDVQLILNRFVIERLLYRLGRSRERRGFILKGALLFDVWTGTPYRPTRDLDLLGRGPDDVASLIARMAGVCWTAVEDDGVTFDADRIEGEAIREGEHYGGVRLHVPASMGTMRTRIQIDIAVGDAAAGAHEGTYPALLDLPAPKLRMYSREDVVAEKFEAIVALGAANSRMKDVFDLWVLQRGFAFDGPKLADAIAQTFKRRGQIVPTQSPAGLTTEWAGARIQEIRWRAFLRRIGVEGKYPSLADLVDMLVRFLIPIAERIVQGTRFDEQWPAGGPWRAGRGAA